MAIKRVDLGSLADRVVQMLERSKVNLGRRTKARIHLLDEITQVIQGAPPPSRHDCIVPRRENGPRASSTMVGPGGVVQMTAGDSARADEDLGYAR